MNVPAWQSVHALLRLEEANFPSGHELQLEMPVVEYVPGKQAKHCESRVVGPTVPAGQGRQVCDPAAEYCPVGQSTHEPEDEEVPALHELHPPEPVDAVTDPLGHGAQFALPLPLAKVLTGQAEQTVVLLE